MNFCKSLAAGLLLALLVPNAPADEFGTLFTTASQRARLDSGIRNTTSGKAGGSGGTAQTAQAPLPLRFNGTLIGRSGQKEVWINGKPELHNSLRRHPRVNLVRNGNIQFRPAAAGSTRLMKPGQVYDPQTGAVSEAYQQAPHNLQPE
ncbi:MAG TPA: hypothetical protein ENK49_05825 [Gammaproteobacteria bacterium]|nr:hypothetical protein [Gammaproteobacteria bacterium]